MSRYGWDLKSHRLLDLALFSACWVQSHHARIYWCELQHHKQHRYCNLVCQKRDIAITWQLITADLWLRYLLQVVSFLIIDLVCVCVCRWWCGCRWCFSWLWRNQLEDHRSQESNRPWFRNHMCALFEIELWVPFQQLLTAVLNSKELPVFHYEICSYPTALFDSPLSCLSPTHPHWLHTYKCSC